jgi:hypothetical protein
MINVKDIRFGNWLCAEEDHWGTVQSVANAIIIKHALTTQSYTPEQLTPIKLTVHMLPLCGFEMIDAGYRHKESYHLLRYMGEGNLILDIAGEPRKFSYVHQLQNIYFDLTGKLLAPNLYGI